VILCRHVWLPVHTCQVFPFKPGREPSTVLLEECLACRARRNSEWAGLLTLEHFQQEVLKSEIGE